MTCSIKTLINAQLKLMSHFAGSQLPKNVNMVNGVHFQSVHVHMHIYILVVVSYTNKIIEDIVGILPKNLPRGF